MNNTLEDLSTDDEVLRESGMLEGPKKVGKLDLRPVTCATWGYLQSHKIIGASDEDVDDVYSNEFRVAAFVFVHSTPQSDLRSVVFSRAKFAAAVDDFMDREFKYHKDLEPYAEAMSFAVEQYSAACSLATNPNTPGGSSAKN